MRPFSLDSMHRSGIIPRNALGPDPGGNAFRARLRQRPRGSRHFPGQRGKPVRKPQIRSCRAAPFSRARDNARPVGSAPWGRGLGVMPPHGSNRGPSCDRTEQRARTPAATDSFPGRAKSSAPCSTCAREPPCGGQPACNVPTAQPASCSWQPCGAAPAATRCGRFPVHQHQHAPAPPDAAIAATPGKASKARHAVAAGRSCACARPGSRRSGRNGAFLASRPWRAPENPWCTTSRKAVPAPSTRRGPHFGQGKFLHGSARLRRRQGPKDPPRPAWRGYLARLFEG